MDTEQICAELERVRTDYRELVDTATVAELRNPTDGTKWNNEQLLFHMLFGYLLVRNLRFLVWGFSRLPDGASRRFAALLNAGTRPFHVINYVGSLFGARTLGYARMERLMDRVLSGLERSLRAQPERALDRGMHFPVGWDPYFKDYMTLRDLYHYPTQHYDHHRQQLTLAGEGVATSAIGPVPLRSRARTRFHGRRRSRRRNSAPITGQSWAPALMTRPRTEPTT